MRGVCELGWSLIGLKVHVDVDDGGGGERVLKSCGLVLIDYRVTNYAFYRVFVAIGKSPHRLLTLNVMRRMFEIIDLHF